MNSWKTIKPYIIHTRPIAGLVFGTFFIIGAIFALIINGFENLNLLRIIIAWFCWNFIMNGATLAFNSHYDKDEGDIGFLNNPPPIPKYLNIFSLVLFAISAVISYNINMQFFILTLIGIFLGIIYSIPPIRLRNVAGIDLLINSIGYGFLTPLAGYMIIETTLTPTVFITLIILACVVASGFPLTQIYQYEEDKRKGNKLITVLLGKKKAIVLSMILGNLTFIGIMILIITGILPKLLLALSIVYIISVIWIIRWYRNYKTVDEKKEMYKGYILSIIIFLTIILSFIGY